MHSIPFRMVQRGIWSCWLVLERGVFWVPWWRPGGSDGNLQLVPPAGASEVGGPAEVSPSVESLLSRQGLLGP